MEVFRRDLQASVGEDGADGVDAYAGLAVLGCETLCYLVGY